MVDDKMRKLMKICSGKFEFHQSSFFFALNEVVKEYMNHLETRKECYKHKDYELWKDLLEVDFFDLENSVLKGLSILKKRFPALN